MGWMQTNSGQRFDFRSIRPESIKIEDIAHSLASICRYGGHCDTHYSVAQHCILASHLVPAEIALEALLHDAAEAYVGDMTHELKHLPELSGFRQIEAKIEVVIGTKFNLVLPLTKEIKLVDRRLAVTEQRDLFIRKVTWDDPEYNVEPYASRIIPWSPDVAYGMYMERYWKLRRA